MKSKKRLDTVIIFLLISFSLLLFQTNHLKALDTTEAQRLHELDIVHGDGESFLEDKTLTRAEALTIILRLVNKDAVVSYPEFSDIKKTDWFYDDLSIAYSMGIVNGYSDNTFKPKDAISRNSFLKMLIEVLGYQYDTDFLWGDVEEYAYFLGIIEEKLDYDMPLLRGESFTYIVAMLDATMKGDVMTYLDKLLLEQVISEENYIKYRESSTTSIVKLDSIKRPKERYVVVGFTQDIALNQPDLVIEIQSGNQKVRIEDPVKVKIYGRSIHMDLSGIEISKSEHIYCKGLVDVYQSEVSPFSFIYDISDAAIDYEYYLSSVGIMGTELLLIEFSQPMTEEALTLENYRVLKNDVSTFFNIVKISDKQVMLTLENELSAGDRLSVTLLGKMKDIYENTFLDGLVMAYDIHVKTELLQDLQIKTVESLGNGVIRIVYNQPVDSLDGMNRRYYELNDLTEGSGYHIIDNVVATGSGDLLNRQFDLISNQLNDNSMYYLKVAGMHTLGNVYALDQQQIRFTYTDHSFDLIIKSITAVDSQHIRVIFNQPLTHRELNKATIKVGGYVTYRNVLNKDPYCVDLYTEKPLTKAKSFSVSIENLTSLLGIELLNSSKSFTSSSVLRSDIKTIVTTNSVKDYIISFDKEIKAFAEEKPLNVYKLLEDGSLVRLENAAYRIINHQDLLIYEDLKVDKVKAYILNDVYLLGDDFYIGGVMVQIKEK